MKKRPTPGYGMNHRAGKLSDFSKSWILARSFGVSGVGQIDFIDGLCPGNDSQIVTAPDYLSISLLPKRLNANDDQSSDVIGIVCK